MKAIVTQAFPGRPDNDVMTRDIAVGEVIEGDLARVAVELGWADADGEDDGEDRGASADDGVVDLSKMTVKQLQALAADRNVDLGSATKKAEMIALLSAAAPTSE